MSKRESNVHDALADRLFGEAESDPSLKGKKAHKLEEKLRPALLAAQYAQLERADRATLIVISGIDGVGKGATVNQLTEWMDARHIEASAFGAPTPEEKLRPPMWRYWNQLPAKGRTWIVFGSWYAQLVAEFADKDPDIDDAGAQIQAIRDFEAMLAANGIQIVKLWFHLSRDAQKKRTKRLLADPYAAWQVTEQDQEVPRRFAQARRSAAAMISLTDTPHAPWVVIPSADDDLRMIRTAEAVLDTLTRRRVHPPAAPDAPRDVPDQLTGQDYDEAMGKSSYKKALTELTNRLARATRHKSFADRSLVLVFEGQDAAGKGGSIRRVAQALDIRKFSIQQISAPRPFELNRPYLWRFWRDVPAHGRTTIFDRSWYGRVLVERVEGFAKPAEWHRAYDEINEFERQLAEDGAIVLKFWLAISKDEQLRRFRERKTTAYKSYKITREDWRNRKKWDDYLVAANDMLAMTDTTCAPWHVVATNDKRLARIRVLSAIVNALEESL